MKKRFVYLFALFISLSFSSCITLLDEINLNADKSGSVFIGLESGMLASVLNMAKDQIPADMMKSVNEFPNEATKRISDIKGISNIKTLDKVGDGRLGISFNFSNTKALNNAYYALLDIGKTWYLPKIIKIRKHQIIRRDLTPQLVKQIEKNNPEIKDSEILKFLNWETVVNLPRESKSGSKQVVVKYSLTEIIKEEKPTSFKILF
ncbi:MAG: hypothetical protein KAG64_09265 [Bacteroidales bacterium]|nr:hypothetical protein [Bacteroidales bacterium]